jgi:hypothetical protein
MSRSPAVLLIESFVLHAIGASSDERERLAERMVQQVFGRSEPNWRIVLREEFGLAAGIDDRLREMWTQASELARQRDVELTPEQFATMVVEENFSDAVEMVGTEILTGLE